MEIKLLNENHNKSAFQWRRGRKSNNPLVGKFDLSVLEKCLVLQNYRLILRMIDEQSWILRNTIIWNKPNPMPSGVKDRFTNFYVTLTIQCLCWLKERSIGLI